MEKLTADPNTGKVIWTRNAFHTMAEIGLFDATYYELLEGEIFQVLISEAHTAVLTELALAFTQTFGAEHICIHSPLVVGQHSELRPDIAVLKPINDQECNTPDLSEHVYSLVAEIADTTLERDRSKKARLYAEAGAAEYWIVNISGRTVIVHRNPIEGDYRSIQTFDDTVSVAPETAPDQPIYLSEILPPENNL